MRLLDCSFDSPAWNLALDEALLDAVEEGLSSEALRFWESPAPFVVLGTAQEAAAEADLAACEADAVPVLRRCSAGGCVLQGPGSLNYALALEADARPETRTLKGSYCFILHTLEAAFAALGVATRHEGTCDLALAGRKVSGNAQKRRRRAFLHHGTLLYRADAAAMARYLREPADRPEYRGNRDHAGFVTALPLAPAAIKDALRAAFRADPAPTPPTPWEMAHAEALVREKYARPEWNLRR